jgi:hypothetical protein
VSGRLHALRSQREFIVSPLRHGRAPAPVDPVVGFGDGAWTIEVESEPPPEPGPDEYEIPLDRVFTEASNHGRAEWYFLDAATEG